MEEKILTEAQSKEGSNLLTPQERDVCREMVQGSAPHSQRALALLALDQGVTQQDASELSGLTKGQVRYWRDKFRQERLRIFPKDAPAKKAAISPAGKRPDQTPRSESVATSKATSGKKAGKKSKKAGAKKKKKSKGDKSKKSKKKKKTGKKRKKKKKGKKSKKGSKRGKKRGKSS